MPLGRTYTVSSGPYTVSGTSVTPILMGSTGASVTADVIAIRVGTDSQAGVSYPANASCQVIFARPANSPVVGSSATVTPSPHNSSDIAANSVWSIGNLGGGTNWSTPPTAPAIGATGWLWSQAIPMASGAGWAEWTNLGAEWRLGASAFVAVFVQCSASGTNVGYMCELVFVE